MKKACVIGHFREGKSLLNGQTIKTKILTEELYRRYGKNNILTIDTHGGYKTVIRVFFEMGDAFRKCSNIIILPANNGIHIIPRFICFWNFFYRRKIHYDVIGGWLPDTLKKTKKLVRLLKTYSGIYVEVESMKNSLNELGLNNVYVIPNCKNLDIVPERELNRLKFDVIKLCTFSRVMKEKGIEDAVNVIESLNQECGSAKFELDIYGQIEEDQREWFDELEKQFSPQVKYCGVVNFDKSTSVLRKYHALLFPTFYAGEGFAGTIIDAMAAGVPVVASNWKYNKEVIVEGYNGMLFETHDLEGLKKALLEIVNNSDSFYSMKKNCIKEATKYLPSAALKQLFDRL